MKSWPVVAVAFAALLGACSREPGRAIQASSIGDPARGKSTIMSSSCGACHAIPGVQQADGMVGPPLDPFRPPNHGGRLPAQHPRQRHPVDPLSPVVLPGNAMPNSGLSEGQARDVTAYLYTLR